MVTGRYPFEHGIRGLLGFTRPPNVATVAGALKEAGYWTEVDVTGPLLPQVRLFEEFDDSRYVHRRQATVHGPRGDELARRVRTLRKEGKPWFFVFHVWDLHTHRQVPPGFSGPALSRTAYDRALGALDARLAKLLPDEVLDGVTVCLVGDHGENLRLEPRGKIGKGFANLLWWKQTKWFMQPLTERYIAYGARSSSKRALRTAPRALITHGHHLFEPLLRVPYVLAGEGIPAGTSDALVSHTDLAPTFAELAGTWFQGGIDSLPLPLNGGGEVERAIVLETAWATPIAGTRQVGLRTRRWKYMQLADGGSPALFDLEADPGERRNVAERHREVAAEFRDQLTLMLADSQEGTRMSDEDAAIVEQRLRDLGYM
jgi:arylsulfatase A-like enzyme